MPPEASRQVPGGHCSLHLSGDRGWPAGSVCRRSMKMVGGSIFSLMPSAAFWPGSAWKPGFVRAHLRNSVSTLSYSLTPATLQGSSAGLAMSAGYCWLPGTETHSQLAQCKRDFIGSDSRRQWSH